MKTANKHPSELKISIWATINAIIRILLININGYIFRSEGKQWGNSIRVDECAKVSVCIKVGGRSKHNGSLSVPPSSPLSLTAHYCAIGEPSWDDFRCCSNTEEMLCQTAIPRPRCAMLWGRFYSLEGCQSLLKQYCRKMMSLFITLTAIRTFEER